MTRTLSAVLLDAAGEILLLVHPETLEIAEAGGGALHALGYSRKSLLGQPITAIECALADVFFWEEVRQGSALPAKDIEGSYLCADGSILPALKTVNRLPGQPGWLAVRAVPDASLKQAADELADVSSRLRATLEASADGILLVDRAGAIVNMNRRFSEMWQIPDALLARRDDAAILRFMAGRFADPERFFASASSLRPDTEQETFATLHLQDGRVLECKSRPARQDEQIIGRVYTYSDVTERFQTQQELIRARDQAKAASRAKGEFLAMMSHEIRTPMNGILGNAQLLGMTTLNDEQAEYARVISASGEALLAIINDILDYSKIEAGKLRLENAPFDLAGLLGDIEQLFVARIREQAVRYECACAPEIPARLIGDAIRLRQILINLVGNAFKFTHEGSIRLSVSLVAHDAAGIRLRFSVQDTGIGIPAAKLRRIFNPFEQADRSTSRRFGGTGLGLSICRQLTALMGGDIGVNSEQGRGSEFWFTVTLQPGEAVKVDVAPEAELPQTLRRDTRILVADDNRVNQLMLAKMLEKLGAAAVTVVGGGREALEHCQQARFDLVFMDVRMPDMDGLEATRALRDLGIGARIVGVSADAMVEDAQAALAAGMDDYVSKPITVAALVATIGRWRQSLRV